MFDQSDTRHRSKPQLSWLDGMNPSRWLSFAKHLLWFDAKQAKALNEPNIEEINFGKLMQFLPEVGDKMQAIAVEFSHISEPEVLLDICKTLTRGKSVCLIELLDIALLFSELPGSHTENMRYLMRFPEELSSAMLTMTRWISTTKLGLERELQHNEVNSMNAAHMVTARAILEGLLNYKVKHGLPKLLKDPRLTEHCRVIMREIINKHAKLTGEFDASGQPTVRLAGFASYNHAMKAHPECVDGLDVVGQLFSEVRKHIESADVVGYAGGYEPNAYGGLRRKLMSTEEMSTSFGQSTYRSFPFKDCSSVINRCHRDRLYRYGCFL